MDGCLSRCGGDAGDGDGEGQGWVQGWRSLVSDGDDASGYLRLGRFASYCESLVRWWC